MFLFIFVYMFLSEFVNKYLEDYYIRISNEILRSINFSKLSINIPNLQKIY